MDFFALFSAPFQMLLNRRPDFHLHSTNMSDPDDPCLRDADRVLRHWHGPYVRESSDTSPFVCKPFAGEGTVPLVEIEVDDDVADS